MLFPNRLSGDVVDRYNHTWVVLLILVLALTSFIIPLHPSYRLGEPTPKNPQQSQPQRKTSDHPKVTATCWTPVQFTIAQNGYVNAFCSDAFNAALRGDNDTNAYILDFSELLKPNRPMKSIAVSRKPYFDMKRQEDDRVSKGENLHLRVEKLVTFQAPLMLLLAAILLTLPHVIWSMLTACCGTFNMEQTLESASQTSRRLDASSQHELCDHFYLSLVQVCRSCPRTLSILYLIKKVLAVVIALVLVIVVCQHALPEVGEINKDLDSISLPLSVSTNSYGDGSNTSTSTVQHSSDLIKLPSDVFLCDFKIRNFADVQRYTVQCVVAEIEQRDTMTQTTQVKPGAQIPRSWTNERNLVEFESLLFKIVTAILAILVVGNAISLFAWLCKLMTSGSRVFLGLTSSAAMDIVFTVQMARINTSADVVRRLVLSSSGKDAGEMMSLTDPQAVKS